MTFGTGFGKLGASFGRLGASGGSGDPTLLTAANVDAFLTSLGLTQAGTGTTYGETGEAATPLYAVPAGKVPLATETVIGREWFGPIVNPAGTNLVTYSRDLTTGWTLTGCTASLELGGLTKGADWRGEEIAADWLVDNSGWLNVDGTHFTISGGTLTTVGTVASQRATRASAIEAGKFYWVEVTGSDNDVRVEFNIGAAGVNDIVTAQTSPRILRAASTSVGVRHGGVAGATITGISVREVDVHTLLTATAPQATATLPITSTSGERVSKYYAQTEDTVLVSHGAVTEAALVDEDFNSYADRAALLAGGWVEVSGTLGISSGKMTLDASSASAWAAFEITGYTAGTRLKISYDIPDSNVSGVSLTNTQAGGAVANGDTTTGTGKVFYYNVTSSDTALWFIARRNASAGLFSVDNVKVEVVSETTLPTGTNPVATDLAAATFANPQMAIRIPTSGDTVRVYGVSHQVAARNLRPFTEQTAGATATVGARSLIRTYGTDLTDVDVSFVVVNGPETSLGYYLCATDLVENGDPLFGVRRFSGNIELIRGSGGFTTANIVASYSNDTAYKIDVQANSTHVRARVNGGSWQTLGAVPSGIRRLSVGRWTSVYTANCPILAFRDNNGNLLDGQRGWNHSLIDNWSA